jgi:hypothetical protein
VASVFGLFPLACRSVWLCQGGSFSFEAAAFDFWTNVLPVDVINHERRGPLIPPRTLVIPSQFTSYRSCFAAALDFGSVGELSSSTESQCCLGFLGESTTSWYSPSHSESVCALLPRTDLSFLRSACAQESPAPVPPYRRRPRISFLH